MKQFRDNAGRCWSLEINVWRIKRVKAVLAVDLLLLDEGDPPLGARLETDMVLVGDVLFVLLEEQAEASEPPVSDEDFGKGLGREGYAAAHDALLEELQDFFRGAGRSELAEAIGAAREVQKEAQKLAVEKVQRLDAAAYVRDLMEKAEQAATTRTPGATSISSPESQESTPTHSP